MEGGRVRGIRGGGRLKHKRVKIHVRTCSTNWQWKCCNPLFTALLCSLVTVEYCECSVCGQEQAR